MNNDTEHVRPDEAIEREPIVLLADDDDAGVQPPADANRRVSICSQNVTDD